MILFCIDSIYENAVAFLYAQSPKWCRVTTSSLCLVNQFPSFIRYLFLDSRIRRPNFHHVDWSFILTISKTNAYICYGRCIARIVSSVEGPTLYPIYLLAYLVLRR